MIRWLISISSHHFAKNYDPRISISFIKEFEGKGSDSYQILSVSSANHQSFMDKTDF